MFRTENQNNLEIALNQFNRAVAKRFEATGGASAYEVGYLHSTLIHYIKFLPKTKQKELIRDLVDGVQRQEERMQEVAWFKDFQEAA